MSTAPNYSPEQQPVSQPKNGLGTAGSVLGVIGLLLSFIPLVGIVAWPLVILGLVVSILGVNRAARGVATTRRDIQKSASGLEVRPETRPAEGLANGAAGRRLARGDCLS